MSIFKVTVEQRKLKRQNWSSFKKADDIKEHDSSPLENAGTDLVSPPPKSSSKYLIISV